MKSISQLRKDLHKIKSNHTNASKNSKQGFKNDAHCKSLCCAFRRKLFSSNLKTLTSTGFFAHELIIVAATKLNFRETRRFKLWIFKQVRMCFVWHLNITSSMARKIYPINNYQFVEGDSIIFSRLSFLPFETW